MARSDKFSHLNAIEFITAVKSFVVQATKEMKRRRRRGKIV
jgi:hypothetical protein